MPYEVIQQEVFRVLEKFFRPEFLNRIDEIIVFSGLSQTEIEAIVDLQIDLLNQKLSEQQIRAQLTDKAKQYLAQVGYDPVFGARPLKRVIAKQVENLIAEKILQERIQPGQTVTIDATDNRLVLTT